MLTEFTKLINNKIKKVWNFFKFRTLFLRGLYYIHLIHYTICSGKVSESLAQNPFPLHITFFIKFIPEKSSTNCFVLSGYVGFQFKHHSADNGYFNISIHHVRYKYIVVACGCTDPFQLTDIPKISLRTVGIIIKK